MATSSQNAGYLVPASEPVNDDAYEDIVQSAIVGITGLPGSSVRPRWQVNPPNLPNIESDWCAFGQQNQTPEQFVWEGHDPTGAAGEGINVVEKDVEQEWLCSFYGPNCRAVAERFRTGLAVGQNRAALITQGVMVVGCGDLVSVPALLQQRWSKRVDTRLTLRRRLRFTFPIRTIEQSGSLGLDNEVYVTPIVIPQS